MFLTKGQHRGWLLVCAIRIHLHLLLGRLHQFVHRHQFLHVYFLNVRVRFVGFGGLLLRRLLAALAWLRESTR